MKKVNHFLNKLDNFFALIAAGAILVLMIWVFLDATLRSAFGISIVGTIEITGEYLMVIIVYLSISYTFKEEGHVSVDLLDEKMSQKMKRILRIVTNILALVIILILGSNNLMAALGFLQRDVRSVGLLGYPLAPVMFIITIGLFVLSIRLIVDSINEAMALKEKS